MSLSSQFLDIAKNWSKSLIRIYSQLYLAHPLGVTPLEFRPDLWSQNTRMNRLLSGVIRVILSLAVLVQCLHVTDRQTDIQTDRQTHNDSTALA